MELRYRTSSDQTIVDRTFYSEAGRPEPLLGRSDFSRSSSITDVAKKKKIKKGRMKGKFPATPCEHVHVTFEGSKVVPRFAGGTVSAVRWYSSQEWPLGFTAQTFNQYLKTYSTPAVQDHAINAFYALSDQMPEEVNLVNFFLELKEIGELIPKLSGSISKDVGNGFLSYNFGWAPFIGDLIKLKDLMTTVDARLAFLRESRGKLTRLSVEFQPAWEPPVWPPDLSHFFGNDFDCSSIARLVSYESTFRASGLLYHELEGLDGLAGSVRGALSALGFGNPLQTAWNAIPFSFILDWVGDVSGHLRKLRAAPFSGEWRLHNFTYVVEDSAEFDLSFAYRTNHGFQIYENHEVHRGRIKVERFIRGVGLPAPASLLTLPVSAKQFALLVALARPSAYR